MEEVGSRNKNVLDDRTPSEAEALSALLKRLHSGGSGPGVRTLPHILGVRHVGIRAKPVSSTGEGARRVINS